MYRICDELSEECDGRPCSPSGFCVGTPCKYLAADLFGLKLLPGSSKDFDAKTDLDEPVQIRTSGKGSYIPIRNGNGLLLVVRIRRTSLESIYGAPAINARNKVRAPNHRGIRTISLTVLRKLNSDLIPSLRIQKIRQV